MELQMGDLRDFTKNNPVLSFREEKGSKDVVLLKNTTGPRDASSKKFDQVPQLTHNHEECPLCRRIV